ncbi:MAG TPA: hypothetical protein VFQ35_01840 [Polyangiaceae bacterium]|nr:hypothetical protein [Polyangiaceae bacterium]
MQAFGTGALRGRAEPEDNREQAVWMPAFPLGSPGWRQSAEPLCVQDRSGLGVAGELNSFGVWADARGVWTSASWGSVNNGGPTKVRFNDGHRWVTWLQDEVGGRDTPIPATNQLSGFPNGPLMLLNYRSYDFSPSIAPADSVALLDSSSLTFEPPLGTSSDSFAVAAFGIGATDGYALIQERVANPSSTVHRYRGEHTWSLVGPIYTSASAIWASDTQVLVATDRWLFRHAPSDSQFLPMPLAPVTEYHSVWAFSDDDIWAGTGDGQLAHFDGVGWTLQSTGLNTPITRLWGSDGELFYISEAHFGRVRNGLPETLIADTAQVRFWDLWGRSSKEVFITLTDPTLAKYRCGPKRILWFDGELFHTF